MSILNYFRRKDPATKGIFLPAPTSESIACANAVVSNLGEEAPPSKKRKTPQRYDGSTRAQIGRYAYLHGPQAAVRHFTKLRGHVLPESTARKFRDAYKTELTKGSQTLSPACIKTLPTKPRGRPLMLGDLDDLVKDYVKQLREAGGVVSTDVVMAAARGIVISKNRALLKDYGGHISIEKSWARSLLIRMNFVKRKGSTAAKLPPADFAKVKGDYLERIKTTVFENHIVPQLVLNWDQTAVRLVPYSEWTMEEQGTNKISIKGLNDKREITALLTITLSGSILPPQLLYSGKTERCHPDCNFPSDWDIWHTENHWSNKSTILRYIENVLKPYLEKKRQELELPDTHKALLIMDVFQAHRCEEVLQKLEECNVAVVFVPANCTDQLQPLDLSVNKPLKSSMRKCFVNWYSARVAEQINSERLVSNININLAMSVVKILSANWFIESFDYIKSSPDTILNGFRAAGILDILNM